MKQLFSDIGSPKSTIHMMQSFGNLVTCARSVEFRSGGLQIFDLFAFLILRFGHTGTLGSVLKPGSPRK